MYELSILINGFPGRSSTHGGFGWSTVALLSKGNQQILVDGGGLGARSLLLRKLTEKGLRPEDITTVLLTHTHWDHAVNWPMFPNAEVILGRIDLEWALNLPPVQCSVPEMYIRELSRSPRLKLVEHLDEVLPGITSHLVAGHTPGQMAYLVDNGETDIIIAADAAKHRAELVTRQVSLTLDGEASKRSIEYVWKLWTGKPGSLLVPGHDTPMVLDNGIPVYTAERDVNIEAWYGTCPDDLTKLS